MVGTKDLTWLCKQLKSPSLLAGVSRLGDRAREEAWSHEEFLAACLEREVSARASHGGEARIRAARFPARKTLEDFDFDHQRSVRKEVVAHLGALDFIEAKANAIFLGPPGTGKTHLCIAIGIRAALAGYRVAFATATEWVARLGAAHDAGRLHQELRRLVRTPLVIIDEVGYIPFEPEAAKLFFQLISSRYERASVIVSSNKAFSRWGEVLGDDTVAAAMIDRLVHHAEVVALKGDSFRLRGRELGKVPRTMAEIILYWVLMALVGLSTVQTEPRLTPLPGVLQRFSRLRCESHYPARGPPTKLTRTVHRRGGRSLAVPSHLLGVSDIHP